MRRDPDLCRSILAAIEELDEQHPEEADLDERISGFDWMLAKRVNRLQDGDPPVNVRHHSDRIILRHLELLEEAGLIARYDPKDIDEGFPWVIDYRLTWKGHEFLETVRADGFWEKVKSLVSEKTGGFAFDLLLEAAKRLFHGML